MNRLRQVWRNRDGLSLIDVLIGLVILLIALSSSFLLTLQASQLMQRNQRLSNAASLAEYKLEELRNSDFDTLASGADTTDLNALGGVGDEFSRSWVVQDDTPVAGLKEVTVTVTWTGNAGQRTYDLTGVVEPGGGSP